MLHVSRVPFSFPFFSYSLLSSWQINTRIWLACSTSDPIRVTHTSLDISYKIVSYLSSWSVHTYSKIPLSAPASTYDSSLQNISHVSFRFLWLWLVFMWNPPPHQFIYRFRHYVIISLMIHRSAYGAMLYWLFVARRKGHWNGFRTINYASDDNMRYETIW